MSTPIEVHKLLKNLDTENSSAIELGSYLFVFQLKVKLLLLFAQKLQISDSILIQRSSLT